MTSTNTSTADNNAIPCSAEPNTKTSSTYIGKGQTIQIISKDKNIENIDLYVIGSKTNVKNENISEDEKQIAIIIVYDIFGWQENCSDITRKNANAFEFCDMISKTLGNRYLVVMGNHFRGNPWPINAQSWEGISEWIPPAFKSANQDMHHLILPYLKNTLNINACVIVGQCFGGKIAFNQCHQSLNAAVVENSNNENVNTDRCLIRALVSLHGSRITKEDVENINVPVFYVQTSDDFDLNIVQRILNKREFGNLCKYELSELGHGFSGGRGDYSDAKFKENVIQVLIEKIKLFLSAIFDIKTSNMN